MPKARYTPYLLVDICSETLWVCGNCEQAEFESFRRAAERTRVTFVIFPYCTSLFAKMNIEPPNLMQYSRLVDDP